jgi:hypothetical protein
MTIRWQQKWGCWMYIYRAQTRNMVLEGRGHARRMPLQARAQHESRSGLSGRTLSARDGESSGLNHKLSACGGGARVQLARTCLRGNSIRT